MQTDVLADRRARPTVLFVDDQWGYGPVTMAMAVADEMDGRAVRVFAGQGPSFELARRARFEKLVRADTLAGAPDPALDRALDSCDVVVSVMNGRVADRAARRGLPCVYVDSLLWMWPAPPAVPANVPYVQENFPGSASRLEAWRDRLHEPEIVGPLVSWPSGRPAGDPDLALVNFGGLSCSALEPRTLLAYADTMGRCALAALAGWPGRVVIACGRHVLDAMNLRALRRLRPAVEVVDLGHDAYLAELRRSRLLISSAGMHAIYEACAWGVPCLYLPAQNLSQALALEALARESVAQPLDWSRLYGLRGLDANDEEAACRRIAEMIHRFERDRAAQDALTGHLGAAMGDRDLAHLRRRQAAFLRRMGGRGAPRVAARVLARLQAVA